MAITQALDHVPVHNHAGLPSVSRYSLSCRHPDCLEEVRKYRKRVKARYQAESYRDLRRRENQWNWGEEALKIHHTGPSGNHSPMT
jgi:hypothetical protein